MDTIEKSIPMNKSLIELETNPLRLWHMVFAVIFLVGMIYMSFQNYLLFHTVIEIFALVIAFMMVTIAMNTGRFISSQFNFISILGISYGIIGVFDLIHTLSFKGMGVFPGITANLPTELWIASQYLRSLALLIAFSIMDRPAKPKRIMAAFVGVAILMFASIFIFDVFPDCYIEGYGLTPFKKISEVIISLTLLAGAAVLFLKRKSLPVKTYRTLLLSIIFMIISEVMFIFYIDVYGLSNMIGHIAKLISFYLVYKAIVAVNLINPVISLARSEKTNADLIARLPESVLIYQDQEIIFANAAAVALFGEAGLNKGLAGLLKETDHDQIDHDQVRDKLIVRPDGSAAHVEIKTLPFHFQGQQSTMAIVHDVTARRSAEQVARRNAELQIEAEVLRKADRNKNDFINALSHELRNPLAAIVAGFSLMNLSTDGQKTLRAKEVIERQINQLCHLVDDLLDLTRITNNKIVLKTEPVELVNLASHVVEDHHLLFEKKGIDLKANLQLQQIHLKADPVRLKQIIGNLLQNAAKFTDRGGQVTVSVSNESEAAVIRVKDTGIGIKPEFLYSLFEPFKQANASIDRSDGGLGLGLAIVKGIVDLHGGNVRAHSEGPGKGTEFIIRLPVPSL